MSRGPALLAWILLAGAGASLAACGPPPKPPLPNIVWPTPPEVPRYKLEAIRVGEEDYLSRPSLLRRIFLGAKNPSEYLRLAQPMGVACHPTKKVVYVTDVRLARVLAFDEEKRKLRVYGEAAQGRLDTCNAVAVDERGTVYAADGKAAVVYAYNEDGSLRATYGQRREFGLPSGLAVDSKRGRLFVADTRKHVIHVVDLQSGRVVDTWGKRGSGDGELNFPGFLALDPEGNLLVSDSMNFRYQLLSRDGKFITKLGQAGNVPGTFFRLKGVAFDSEGHIYAVDASFGNIQVFTRDGQLLLFFGQPGQQPGEFYLPYGICIDRDDVLWVADQLNKRVQSIRYLRTPQGAGTPAPATQPATPAPTKSAP